MSIIEGLTEEQNAALNASLEQRDAKLKQEMEAQFGERLASETQGLKTKNAELIEEKRKAKELADQQTAEAQRKAEEAAKAAGNTDHLEQLYQERLGKTQEEFKSMNQSWEQKLGALQTEASEKITAAEQTIHKLLVTDQATKLAADLSPDHYKVLLPHVKAKIGMQQDPVSGEYKTVVMDESGNPTAFTLDDLKKQFSEDETFASLITATRAKGSNASGTRTSTGRAGGVDTGKAFTDMTTAEKVDYLKAKQA